MLVTAHQHVELRTELEKRNDGLWIALNGEIQRGGLELQTWFLLEDDQKIPKIFEIFYDVSKTLRMSCTETNFWVSFTQLRGRKLVFWAGYDSEDLNSGKIPGDWSSFPQENEIEKLDVAVFPILKDVLAHRN